MKFINNIALLVLLMLGVASCVDKEPDYGNFDTRDVDFTYAVDGDEYAIDYYVVSTFQFTNTSSKTGSVKWDFGDGQTSTEQNPLHKYDKAGLYQVSLTVDGVGTRTSPLLVYDISPVLSVTSQTAPTVVINNVEVNLDIELPNPEDLICKYVWTFPEGTLDADGNELTEFVGYSHADGTIDNPGALHFRHIGSQRIELQTWFDVNGENRRLEDSYVNVQVGSSIPAPTLYYAAKDGNIMAYKLVDLSQLPAGTKNLPFDLGVSAGTMPQQIVFATESTEAEDGVVEQDNVYILDAGKQYTYVNDENSTLGDGKITVMSADGASTNIMVTNVGGQAFNDPFMGMAADGYLYYSDRNTGIRRLPLSTRGEKESTHYSSTDGYWVVNNQLSYYGQGIAYGAVHTGLYRDASGLYYWGKNYSGNGIYRFRQGDIGNTGTGVAIPHPILLSGSQPKAFTIDEALGRLYVWMTKGDPGSGFLDYNLPGSADGLAINAYNTFIQMDADAINSTDAEGVYVSQMAVDAQTHYVYFGFRSNDKNYTTGLYYYDPSTQKVAKYCDNTDAILGVTINPRLTNLF